LPEAPKSDRKMTIAQGIEIFDRPLAAVGLTIF
jgi:hypothetical protein